MWYTTNFQINTSPSIIEGLFFFSVIKRYRANFSGGHLTIVVAHAILRIAYYLLTRKEMYVDLGEDYFDKQWQVSIVRHSVRRLENLGYTVTITEAS